MYDIPPSINMNRQGVLPKPQSAHTVIPCSIYTVADVLEIYLEKKHVFQIPFFWLMNDRGTCTCILNVHIAVSALYADRVPGVLVRDSLPGLCW